MSNTGTTLRLELRPSWRLAALVTGVHALAGICVLAVSPTPMGATLAALLAALGAAAAWNRALLRGRRAPRSLRISARGDAEILLSGGASREVGSGPRTVSRFLVALPLQGSPRRSILIAADMLDPAGFRLLRLWALWGKLPGVASAPLPA